MSLSYIFEYVYGNIARDYLNLELRHHQVLLFILFIFLFFVSLRLQSYTFSFNLQTFWHFFL